MARIPNFKCPICGTPTTKKNIVKSEVFNQICSECKENEQQHINSLALFDNWFRFYLHIPRNVSIWDYEEVMKISPSMEENVKVYLEEYPEDGIETAYNRQIEDNYTYTHEEFCSEYGLKPE